MNDQLEHYANKLAYEIDSWDLKTALDNGERVVVVDARLRRGAHPRRRQHSASHHE